MINLSGEFRYYLCTDNVTLRFRHRGLREYIKSKLHRDPCNGDVYIFLSRDLSRLRVYYFHHNGEIADTVRQMTQFMMSKGPVTLSDSLRDAIVAGVKEEFEAKLREERDAHEKAIQSLKDQFAIMLAAKDNEIAALKAKNGEGQGGAHGTINCTATMQDH